MTFRDAFGGFGGWFSNGQANMQSGIGQAQMTPAQVAQLASKMAQVQVQVQPYTLGYPLPKLKSQEEVERQKAFSLLFNDWLQEMLGTVGYRYITAVHVHYLVHAELGGLFASCYPFGCVGDAASSADVVFVSMMANTQLSDPHPTPFVLRMPEHMYSDIVARAIAEKLSNGRTV